MESYGEIVDLMTGDYPTLEYTVQYRETNLNFALRLMEKYGIYYYFKFDKGDGDSPSTHYLVLAELDHTRNPARARLGHLSGADRRRAHRHSAIQRLEQDASDGIGHVIAQ